MASKMIVLPKKTKKDILEAYHVAMAKVVKDPVFTSKQGKKIMGPFTQLLRDDAMRAMQNAATLGPDTKKWLRNWLTTKYGAFLKKKKKKKKKE
ncbi:MAG: hypothetical protein VW802_12880 [Rhodospirillaceae bacterium]|jgi:hypothetical protein